MPKAFGHLCTNLIRLRAQNRESQPRIRLVPLPASEKQSASGAGALHPAVGSWQTHTCPAVLSPGPPVPSARPAPLRPPGPGPLPASRPRTSPPRLGLRRGRRGCGPAPEGRPLAVRAILHPAHSAARRLAGKLPYYCDAEIGETLSRVGGAVTVGIPRGGSAAAEVRGARGPGSRKEGTAEPRRGTAVRARLSEGRLPLRLRGASRDSPGQGARGGLGAAPAVPAGRGRAGVSRAPPRRPRGAPCDLQSPSARGGRKPLQRLERPPPRLGCLRTGRNCDAESQKEDPPLPPRPPLFKFRGFGDTAAARGADSAPRSGSRRGLCAWGNPGGREELALGTRGARRPR